MAEKSIDFPSGSLTLEGVWHLPEETGPLPAVIVCHPHPLYGGDMDNGIVVGVCRQLARRGINALRFNFRGVGRSQGSYGEALGEQEDLLAAVAYARSVDFVDKARIGVCGYSFGAGVILAAAPRLKDVQALAVISPPLSPGNQFDPGRFAGAKFFIGGSEDAMFPSAELRRFAGKLPPPREYEIVEGADHFWGGSERQLVQKVADFFQRTFNEHN